MLPIDMEEPIISLTAAGIGTLLAGVTFVVGIATTYLRLFVSKEMSNLKDQITSSTDSKINRMMEEFHPKELVDERFRSMAIEVSYLKRWMEWMGGPKAKQVHDETGL